MKSIKEKSVEYAPYTENDSWSRIERCEIAQISFESGANYVLEEIEKLVKFNRWAAQDLYDLIEQLKK